MKVARGKNYVRILKWQPKKKENERNFFDNIFWWKLN